jgi:hypothetical protein
MQSRSLRLRVFDIIRSSPEGVMIDELCRKLKSPESSITSRISELKKSGCVVVHIRESRRYYVQVEGVTDEKNKHKSKCKTKSLKEWEDEVIGAAKSYAFSGHNASKLLAIAENYPTKKGELVCL